MGLRQRACWQAAEAKEQMRKAYETTKETSKDTVQSAKEKLGGGGGKDK